jgi:D-alanyl-D-alanine carboxypeptidase
MDVTSESVGFDLLESFGETEEGQYIADHAHEYGFIIRYPQGKTAITGYSYEPWHLRYLGVDVATDIYNSGKTMEEYYGLV